MTRESKSKIVTRGKSTRAKKEEELSRKKKRNEESDSSDDNEEDDDDSENDNDEMDAHEYRKFLSKIFPSNHLNKKIKSGEKIKEFLDDLDENGEIKKNAHKKYTKKTNTKRNNKKEESSEDEEEEWESASSEDEEEVKPKKKTKKNKKTKKTIIETDSEEEDDDDETLGSEDTDTEDEDEDDDDGHMCKSNKINIVFTIGGGEDESEWESEDEYDSDYDEDEDDEGTEDEDASVSSCSSEEDLKRSKKSKNSKNSKIVSKDKKSHLKKENEIIENIKSEMSQTKTESTSSTTEDKDILVKLKEMFENNKNNKTIKKCIDMCEEDIKNSKAKQEKKHKKHKDKNLRIFKRIIKDKNTMNDFTFYEKLELPDQKKLIKELKEINKITRVEKPYRMTLLESDMPTIFKGAAMKKINSLRYMEPGSGEFYKIKNWVDTFMRIPFNNYQTLPISIEDGVEKCHDFMEKAQKTLDSAVYGLNDAKMQIMQMLGQLVTNPKAIGTAIAIHGPPGTGKTSLVKEGISKILNRPFAFIALGGATDSSFLEGHSYTYEGSTWGKIIQIIIDSKCMNPVIYFDELDKISDTPRGEEIAGILTHLTDTSQNSQYHDKYFAEIDFDLSKCLFIFSYNDESKVNPILKDRMYRIQTKGYNQKQKTVIGNNYLLPKIREQVKFDENEIIIPDQTIHHIIDNYCDKEDGVRNLKRCLEIIYTKLNLYRLMKPDSNLFEEEMSLKVEFPYTVTKDIVDKLIKQDKSNISSLYGLYV